MSRYRRVTDPVVKTRVCNTCRAVIVGITDRGLEYWLDVTPVVPEVEALYHAVGRPTYLVQPRAGRASWLDWRNPVTSRTAPIRGLVLVEHPHRTPGPKTSDPVWLVTDYAITNAPTGEMQIPSIPTEVPF